MVYNYFKGDLIMDSNIKFGDFVKKRRQELKMSQMDLAKKTNRHQSAISQYENNKHFPMGADEYFILANALKVTVTELMEIVNFSKGKIIKGNEDFLIDLEMLKRDDLNQKYKLIYRGKEVPIDEIKEALDFIQFKHSIKQGEN